jgi:hypothetical protein
MFRQTKRYFALVPLLTALLLAVFLPATAPAGHPGDGVTPTGVIRTDPGAGAGGNLGGGGASGDPDELGIYREPPPPAWISGPVSPRVPGGDVKPSATRLRLRVLRAFLLGFRFPAV